MVGWERIPNTTSAAHGSMSVCCCELSASLAVSTGLMAVFSHRLKFKNIPAFFNDDKQVIRSELVRGCFNECQVLIRSSTITCSPPELFFFWMLDFGVSRQDGWAVKGALKELLFRAVQLTAYVYIQYVSFSSVQMNLNLWSFTLPGNIPFFKIIKTKLPGL